MDMAPRSARGGQLPLSAASRRGSQVPPGGR